MNKLLIIFAVLSAIVPIFAYELHNPIDFEYNKAGNNLLFIIDFSNSMSEYLNSKTKISQVKDSIYRILPQISDDTQVGMRVYGHTCNPIAFNACRSSELVVPIGYGTTTKISETLKNLRPRGMTPITYSLKQAVKRDLNGINGVKHIILLTDGGENCDESPCDYVVELIKTRRDIKIDVIAYDVSDSDDLNQLQCTANVTGGRFIDINTNAQLYNSMGELILPHKNVEAIIYGSE